MIDSITCAPLCLPFLGPLLLTEVLLFEVRQKAGNIARFLIYFKEFKLDLPHIISNLAN